MACRWHSITSAMLFFLSFSILLFEMYLENSMVYDCLLLIGKGLCQFLCPLLVFCLKSRFLYVIPGRSKTLFRYTLSSVFYPYVTVISRAKSSPLVFSVFLIFLKLLIFFPGKMASTVHIKKDWVLLAAVSLSYF